ncbi:hypothetical protein CCAL9344_00585 [Campylobacter sp. RM9344]|uniref:Uncharacterized protein n=1 Tax=Campylobacter californiensis TaxID=1032243 RepID=A0AAW3ZR56_9BACT|nr:MULTISPECIES: hypothetical protein [unclassified Campylobacter]MBE2983847.1 hypothetical protein [Campylobacter sp. RM6883]MBE2985589.1 hypothetical protein [Campylobacter sp. RM12919]MBE2987382.1 hypothetical protein [Campylobacter sp. RM12920]MBE2994385.1 hypothetical protein [Campylobacter sp. RM6913]MBE3022141.1 hypothetical protein [Campylobacter sp. 7477a]MBE3028693.1 hypothetical protein [Campylobacter sp. RM9344]
MKKIISCALIAMMGLSIASTTAFADYARGQKLYLKFMKDATGIKGDAFAAQHTIAEWKGMCENEGEGFIKAMSSKFPSANDFLSGAQFKKFQPDICDFVIHYAKDSGNVPSC